MTRFPPLVRAGLKRKKLRTALSFLPISVAFLSFAFLGATEEPSNAGVNVADKGRLITRHKVSLIQTLPEAYKRRILPVPGVAAVCHQTWFSGVYQDPDKFFGSMAVEPDDFLNVFPEIKLGDAEKQAWKTTPTGAIIGKAVSEKLQKKVGDRISLQSRLWGVPAGKEQWEFDIVGIFDDTRENSNMPGLILRYDYLDEARQKTKGQVSWFIVRITDEDKAAEVAKAIDERFENTPFETKTEPEGAFAAARETPPVDLDKDQLLEILNDD